VVRIKAAKKAAFSFLHPHLLFKMQINPVNNMRDAINCFRWQLHSALNVIKHHFKQTRLTPQLINRIRIGFTGQRLANHSKNLTFRRMNFKAGLAKKSKLGLIEFNNAGIGKSGGRGYIIHNKNLALGF